MSSSLRLARAPRALIGLFVIALVLAACSSSSKKGTSVSGTTGTGAPSASTDYSKLPAAGPLKSSGSTFQKAFDEAAFQGFNEVASQVKFDQYGGGGSSQGKSDLQANSVDFAGTDSLIKPEDTSKYQGGEVLYVPTVAAPITLSYNIDGVDKLQLSGPTIAKIFQGEIKKWDDAAVKADNPGATLPSTNITIVVRSGGSGTTNNFSKFLDKAAKTDWKLGTGDTINFPATAATGASNADVGNKVKSTTGAIGYVDYSDATALSLKFAAVKNAAGNYIDATLDGASAALASADVAADLTYNPIYAPGAQAYPLTSPTWIILYKKQTDHAKGTALKGFLTYVLNEGQDLAKDAGYTKLPDSVRQKAIAHLNDLEIPA